LAQGYYFSEPLPNEALVEVLHLERQGTYLGEAKA